jgi:hypothetical protein
LGGEFLARAGLLGSAVEFSKPLFADEIPNRRGVPGQPPYNACSATHGFGQHSNVPSFEENQA